MKKRILCFLLSAAMLASVTACSGGGDTSSEGSAPAGSGSNAEASQPADSSEPIELTVLNWGSDIDVKINQDAYARLNEKFPNVTVKDNFVTGTATWSEYITKLLTMIGSGNSPDMVMMAIEGVRQLIDNDVVMPLDDRIEGDEDMQAVLDGISPRLVEALAVDGQTYFFPNSWNSIVLYYNTKMFADAGLEAPPADWDWDTFREYAKKLTTGEDNSEDKVYGYGMSTYSIFMTLFPFSNGTSTLTDDQLGSNLSDPKVAEAFQVINDMIYVDGSMPMPEQGMDAAHLFAAVRLAMAAIGPNSVQNMLTADFTDWDVAYLPIQDKENGSHIFGVTGYGILKDTENPDMCWEVIKELVSPETQEAVASAGVSNPVSRSAFETRALEVPKNWEIFYDAIDQNSRCLPAPINDSEYEEILFRYYYEMMNTQQDVSGVLAKADEELQASFDELK